MVQNLARAHDIRRQRMTVRMQPTPKLMQKPEPAPNVVGSSKNIGSEGKTYHNVDSA
jgi:hypothetical protein